MKLRWRRGGGDAAAPDEASGPEVDAETGEILDAAGSVSPVRPEADHVPGERSIPSVNRERSVRSRVTNLLAIGTVVLLGGGFLVWYYATQYARGQEAQAAARRAAEARTAGELKLPPLGRIDPPRPEAGVSRTLFGAPPPLPAAATTPSANPAGPATKSPQQLALERKLGVPVLLRSTSVQAVAATSAEHGDSSGTVTSTDMAALLAAMPGASPSASPPPSSTGLGALLRPTPTPAVGAQVLPTRRFLLPKGAFVDCTLETAIDSTYDGMVTCIGATDVYSADGRVVLLERGTKYVGEKRGEIRQGQGRVFVLWNEARTPTGVVVNLASPGTDELGRTGLPGAVDTHFWDRFGAAILVSVIDGALQALASSQQQGGGTAVVLNPQGSRDVMTDVLRETIAIPPTVVKNQGDRIQVLVARDVDFRGVYGLRIDGGER